MATETSKMNTSWSTRSRNGRGPSSHLPPPTANRSPMRDGSLDDRIEQVLHTLEGTEPEWHVGVEASSHALAAFGPSPRRVGELEEKKEVLATEKEVLAKEK